MTIINLQDDYIYIGISIKSINVIKQQYVEYTYIYILIYVFNIILNSYI